jgi:hypothetical protein
MFDPMPCHQVVQLSDGVKVPVDVYNGGFSIFSGRHVCMSDIPSVRSGIIYMRSAFALRVMGEEHSIEQRTSVDEARIRLSIGE